MKARVYRLGIDARLFVGPMKGSKYGTMIQDEDDLTASPVIGDGFPLRDTFDEAQADLDLYAEQFGLKEEPR